MKNMLNAIHQVLESESGLYGHLLDLIEKERKAVLDADLKNVTQCLREKQDLLMQLEEKNLERSQLAGRLAAELGMTGTHIRLKELIQRIDGEGGGRLAECGNQLSEIVIKVDRENRRNGVLIGQMLQIVRGELELFQKVVQPPNTYRRDGQMQPEGGKAIYHNNI